MDDNPISDTQSPEAAGESGSDEAIVPDQEGESDSQPTASETGEAPETASDDTSSDTTDEAVSDDTSTSEDAKETTNDDDITTWAEKKGIDLKDPIKVAEMARETERQFHRDRQEATALRKQVEANASGDDDRIALVESKLAVREFYDNHPGAKELDGTMAEIVKAKPYLAQDLDALYIIAKDQKRSDDLKAAEAKGRKETKEQIARNSAAKISAGNASSPSTPVKDDKLLEGFEAEF